MILSFKIIVHHYQKHIKWTSHTETIANAVSKYVGVTGRLKHILPLYIPRTLYNTLILPHLWYTIMGI